MDYDIYVLAILRVKIFKFMQNLYHRFKIYKTYILPYYNGRLLVKNVFNVKIIFRMHFVLISHAYHGLCRNCLFFFLLLWNYCSRKHSQCANIFQYIKTRQSRIKQKIIWLLIVEHILSAEFGNAVFESLLLKCWCRRHFRKKTNLIFVLY